MSVSCGGAGVVTPGDRKILLRCTYISLQSHTILDSFNKPADEKLFLPFKGKPKMKLVDCKHITRSLTAAQLSVIFKKNWIPSTFVRSWKFMRIFNKCVTNQIFDWPHCHCPSSSCWSPQFVAANCRNKGSNQYQRNHWVGDGRIRGGYCLLSSAHCCSSEPDCGGVKSQDN